MKPTEIVTLVVAAGALVVSLVQMGRMESRMAAVEARAMKAESAAPAPPAAAPARDFSKEIAALRSDVEALKARPPVSAPAILGATPGNGNAPTPDQEKAKREAAEKQQKEWLDRQVRALADSLETKLGLTAQQKQGVSEALARGYQGLADERKGNPNSEKFKEMLTRTSEKIGEEINALLTPEQQSQYSQLAGGPAGIFGVPLGAGEGGHPAGNGAIHK